MTRKSMTGLALVAAGAGIFILSAHVKRGPQWADAAQVAIDLYDKGRYTEALPAAEKELQIALNSYGDDDMRTVYSKDHLAKICLRTGQPQRALQLFQQTVDTNERILDPDNPRQAYYLSNLAFRLAAAGDYDKAQDLLVRSLRLLQKNYEEITKPVGEGYARIGYLCLLWGRYKEAGEMLRRARAINERIRDSDPLVDADIALNLWLIDDFYGDGINHASDCEKPLSRLQENLPPADPAIARALNASARLDLEQNRNAEARDKFAKAENIYRLYEGVEDRGLLESRLGLAELDTLDNKPADFSTLLGKYGTIVGSNNIALAVAFSRAAKANRMAGKIKEASFYYGMARSIAADAPGDHTDFSLELTLDQAEQEAALGHGQAALAQAEAVLAKTRSEVWDPSSLERKALLTIAGISLKLGKKEAARSATDRLEKIVKHSLGPDHPGNYEAVGQLAGLYSALGDTEKADKYAASYRKLTPAMQHWHPKK